jgi:hypothetical protein
VCTEASFAYNFRRSSSGSDSIHSKHHYSFSTYQKWKTEKDNECQILSWLVCETSGVGAKKSAVKLKYKECMQIPSKN